MTYFTIATVFVIHILTSTVTVLLWPGDKIMKAHTHFWQRAGIETLRQGQNRLGLKKLSIGAQPPLKHDERQMVRVVYYFCKASGLCHCKTSRVQTSPRHPNRHQHNLKAMSQPLSGGSGSPLSFILSTGERLCFFACHVQHCYWKRKYALSSDASAHS